MPPRFIDTYLDSPIIRNERDRVLLQILHYRSLSAKDRKGPHWFRVRAYTELIENRELQALEPEEYQALDALLSPADTWSDVEDADVLARSMASLAKAGLRQWGAPVPDGVFDLGSQSRHPRTRHYYNCMRFFETFINRIACSRAQGKRGMINHVDNGLSLHGDEYKAILQLPGIDTLYLLSYTQVCMLKDMYYGRFNTHLCAAILDPSGELGVTAERCYSWFFNCLTRHGNQGYEVGKYIEALTKTNIIRKNDEILGEGGSHADMLRVCRQKEAEMGTTEDFMADRLESILREDREKAHDVELFGLQKLSGHPLVDPLVGGDKVLSVVRERPAYFTEDIKRIRNNVCRMYYEGYVRKTGRPPPLRFPQGSHGTKLYQLYTHQEQRIHSTSYPLEDWEGVRFAKHHDFDFYPNFTDLMDDKAISFYRTEIGATWDDSIKPSSHRKLLMEMLSRPEINIREIADRARVGDIPFSWKIVSLYPKEREFKLCPRMFGMMVFEMRAFFATTEANVSEFIFPFLPPQTMTLSKQEIQELFLSVTSQNTGDRTERLFGEFDLSSWNLRFRAEVVDPVGYDLEDMFGEPGLFTVIHHFFTDCVMSVRVRECEPPHWREAQQEGAFTDEMSGPLQWNKHYAGIEGLAQKHWAMITYSFMDLGLSQFGHPYYLIGQGDNQIYVMQVEGLSEENRRQELLHLDRQCRAVVAEECAKAGHKLNLDECIGSTTTITYSKQVWINGTDFPTTCKAHSRIFPRSSSDFPSVGNSVGAISGQCLAAAEQSKNPMLSFMLCQFHTALYLRTLHKVRPVETTLLPEGARLKMSQGVTLALMMYPGELGGMSVGHVLGFLYKGGADPTSKAYGSLSLLASGSSIARRIIHTLHSGAWMDKHPVQALLLDDPYALPILRGRTPEMAILNRSMALVNSLTVNREIHELTTTSVSEYEKSLTEILLSVRPFNPVLLADIKGWSISGVKRTTAKMFTSTQTVQALLQGKDEDNPCGIILSAGAGQFYNLVWRLEAMRGTERVVKSVHDDVSQLRKFWDPSGSLSIVGVTTYTPLDSPLEVTQSITGTVGFKTLLRCEDSMDARASRGPHKPYLGKETREKRSQYGYKIITSSAPERAIKRLADILIQPGVGPQMQRLIAEVAKTRGNVDLMALAPYLDKIFGGTLVHRYSSRLGHRGASLLGTQSLATHCIVNTDLATPFSGGTEDYPRMIQEDMVAGLGVVNLVYRLGDVEWCATLRTDLRQYVPLVEVEMELTDQTPIPHPEFPNNRIAYAAEVHLQKVGGAVDTQLIGPFQVPVGHVPAPVLGLARTVSRALRRGHSATAVADRGTGHISFHLDIAEVLGCGVENVIKGCALEGARFTVEAMFSRPDSGLQWTPMPVIVSLSRALARSLLPSLRHPLLQDDPWIVRTAFQSVLSYPLGPRPQVTVLSDKLAALMLQFFQIPLSHLYTTPLVLFGDELAWDSINALTSQFKVIVVQSVMLGQLKPSVAFGLVRKNLSLGLNESRTEAGKIANLYRVVANLGTWAQQEGVPGLTDRFQALLEGREVLRFPISCPEVLRMARSLHRPARNEPTILTNPERGSIDLVLTNWSTIGEAPVLAAECWRTRPDATEWDLFSRDRLVGRVYGGDSAAGYSYVSLAPWVKGEEVFLVGCGAGSGAAVTLLSGATHVVGLDLYHDLDPEALLTNHTTPPLLRKMGLNHKFSRAPVTSRLTGDIMQSVTSDLIQQCVGNGAVYILDIPLLSRDTVLKAFATLSLAEAATRVAVRVLGSHQKLLDILGYCASIDQAVRFVVVYWGLRGGEAWMIFTIRKALPKRQSTVEITTIPVFAPTDDLFLSSLGGGPEYLLEALYGPYSQMRREDTQTVLSATELLVGASVGELEHRFTYTQFTDLLSAVVIHDCHHDPDWSQRVEDILRLDMTTVTIANHEARLSVTPKLRRLLSHTLPRLM